MAPDLKSFEQMLQDELGFKPVDRAEVARVEASVKDHVVKKVSDRLDERQDELEKARTWYVR
jgi:hypothetical protein